MPYTQIQDFLSGYLDSNATLRQWVIISYGLDTSHTILHNKNHDRKYSIVCADAERQVLTFDPYKYKCTERLNTC